MDRVSQTEKMSVSKELKNIEKQSSSNYNSRLRPPEVLIKGSETKLIRKRETFNDMLSEERDV